MSITRRELCARLGAIAAGFSGLKRGLAADGAKTSPAAGGGPYGDLTADPAGLLDLPQGFRYQAFSKTGQTMDDGLLVPPSHDGMAAFPGPGGKTILVRNHEVNANEEATGAFGDENELARDFPWDRFYDPGTSRHAALGGTTTLVYDTRSQRLEQHSLSLTGTVRNCAGGPTPWLSWISCEESVLRATDPLSRDHGYNFEVPATAKMQVVDPTPLKAMGRFNHEAIAVHPRSGVIYQTEDRGDGLIYRFVPNERGRMARGGRLQALALRDKKSADTRNWEVNEIEPGRKWPVHWVDIDNVESPDDDLRLQGFDRGAALFARGEGAWANGDEIYFACTSGGGARGGQIWRYAASAHEGTAEENREPATLDLFLEPNDTNLLEYADNLTIAPWGDLVLCEDGSGVDHILGVTLDGQIYKLGRNAMNEGEFAGATFSADGSTLFVNIQSPGLTLAITGPWRNS
jgi:hypothetical protein